MSEPAAAVVPEDEDLEDGEIESDGDEEVQVAPVPSVKLVPSNKSIAIADPSPPKKVKSNKIAPDDQEDFATSLERQLAQALGKPAPASPVSHSQDDENKRSKGEDRHKTRNRKRRRRNESPIRERERDKTRKNKKPRPEDGAPEEDMDDFEMMNVRGGSPPPPSGAAVPPTPSEGNESDRSYSSYDSYDSSDYHRRQRRKNRTADRSRRESRRREKEQDKQRRVGGGSGGGGGGSSRIEGHSGRHHRGDNNGNESPDREEESRGRDVYKNHPRKMELCKFYLMECCAKREKCLYMHQDFPCKYYYTGSECTQKDCKFGHGKPLTDALRAILMKHLETAPKEILGDFPRLGRELANQKIRSRHKELCMKFNVTDELHGPPPSSFAANSANAVTAERPSSGADANNIPPLNEIYSKPPPPIRGKAEDSRARAQPDKGNSNNHSRKSRWCEQMRLGSDGPMTGANAIPVGNSSFAKGAAGPPPTLAGSEASKSSMSLRNLTNVLTQDQMDKLAAIGIVTLDQVKHLTVLQLTEIGLSISQLSEIQMSAVQVEKTVVVAGGPSNEEVVANEAEKKIPVPEVISAHLIPTDGVIVADTDMRIVPTVTQDVDMRFLGSAAAPITLPPIAISSHSDVNQSRLTRPEIASPDAAEDRLEPNSVVDYSQYLREANLVVVPEQPQGLQEKEEEAAKLQLEQRHTLEEIEEEDDDDDDDDDSKLKICNDEEEEETQEDSEKEKAEPAAVELPVIPSVTYWPMNLASLTSLNKIDLSSSVAQMMNEADKKRDQPTNKIDGFVSMYSGRTEEQSASVANEPTPSVDIAETNKKQQSSLDPRDPRNRDPRNSRDPPKSPPMIRQPQVVIRPSIYDCNEEADDDSSPSPPQRPDQDMRLGDVDLRMPFKPMLQNYVPATEIDGSISSHLPIVYKVFEWVIPTPNFKDIRRRVSSENSQDPRLKRIFGLEVVEDSSKPQQYGSGEPEKSVAPNTDPRTASVAATDPRMDPRRKKEATIQSPGGLAGPPLATGLDIQIVLQKSSWYTDLGSKNKIFVNQQLAALTSELKQYHEEVSASGPRPFEIAKVYEQSPMLVNVLQQLGIVVDDHGVIQPMGPLSGPGMPPMNMNMNDPNVMMPELAAMIQQQQQQRMFNMNPALMHQMQGPGIRAGLLGMPPPNVGFAGPPPFDDFGGGPGGVGPPPGGDMSNFMNYNDNMGVMGQQQQMGMMQQGPGFFPQSQQQQGPPNNRMMMNNNGNRGNFRNNNHNMNMGGGRNDRWLHNNRGGCDGRRHNSRRD